MATNEQNLASFQTAVNNNDVTAIINLFCQDDPTQNPKFPCLGITDHGPAFYGRDDIKSFFEQLFKTFPGMKWTWPPPTASSAPLLKSSDTNTLGVQMTVTGRYQDKWFQPATTRGQKDHSSQPLSQLGPGAMGYLGKTRGDSDGLPAFAVFTFDGSASAYVRQLQIYLDRYALMQSIMGADPDNTWDPDAPAWDSLQRAGKRELKIKQTGGRRITITIED